MIPSQPPAVQALQMFSCLAILHRRVEGATFQHVEALDVPTGD